MPGVRNRDDLPSDLPMIGAMPLQLTSGKPTRRIVSLPTVMLVGVDPLLAAAVREAVAPLPVLRVVHVVAAQERMAPTRPIVVVLGAPVPRNDLDHLRELARACGSSLIHVADVGHARDVPAHVNQVVLAWTREHFTITETGAARGGGR